MFIKNLIDIAKAKLFMEAVGRASIADAAAFLQQRAIAYAPVDTGLLRSSIIVQSSMAGATYNVVATAPYAQWVEFGHMAGSGTFVPPNPFMRRARDDTIRQFPSIVHNAAVRRPSEDGSISHLGVTFHT